MLLPLATKELGTAGLRIPPCVLHQSSVHPKPILFCLGPKHDTLRWDAILGLNQIQLMKHLLCKNYKIMDVKHTNS